MTILYVDDDNDDREIFREAIHSIDKSIVCLTACNGLDALSFLEAQKHLPDVVFLDINMPLMSGTTCLAEIKRSKKMGQVPVIMFTTSTNPTEQAQCKKYGAVEYINKPVSYRHLKETLMAIIKSGNSLLAH